MNIHSRNKKGELTLQGLALQFSRKLSFPFFGDSYFNRNSKSFQESSGKQKEIGTINNNAYFVTRLVTTTRENNA